jgi:hypothetical protein
VDAESLADTGRTVRIDEDLLELTGIAFWALNSAFAGESKDLALDVVKTAVAENPCGSSEEWKQQENGVVLPCLGFWDGYEYNDFLRSIGRL